MELVSVIIPTYNRAETINRAVTSVLSQSYSKLEIIIVDDASTDNTYEVVKEISDERVKYFKLESNLGGAGARNFGIEKAKGSFIAFQDSDDEWLPNKLKSDLELFAKDEKIDCLFSRYWQVDGKFSKLIPMKSSIDNNKLYSDLLVRNLIGTPTAIVKAEVFDKVLGFNASLPRYQDWELFIRIAKEFKVSMNPDVNVLAYVSNDSLSKSNMAHLEALELIYNAHSDEINNIRSLKSLWLWNIGEARALNSLTYKDILWSSLKTRFTIMRAIKFCLISLLGVKAYNWYRMVTFRVARFLSGSRLLAWLKNEDF